MSRNPHKPTDKTKAEVSALCSFGVTESAIAVYLGIDAKTLRKYYRDELDTAKTKAHGAVGKFLFHVASGRALQEGASYADCTRAAMFWAKTQMGFRETEQPTYSAEPVTFTDASTPDETSE